jgi:uncharacterized OB-fold protein
MTAITRIGTYLPTWGIAAGRQVGDDEDAVTLAVAAGLAALERSDRHDPEVDIVVLVTRDLPLLEGGNSAPLLAGLGLGDGVAVREVVGGATAVLEAITAATPGTLVIGSDSAGAAGASAVWCGLGGAELMAAGRVVRSLPVTTRDSAGNSTDYADPRLLRERGVNEALARLGAPEPVAVAGIVGKDAAAICTGTPPLLTTTGASSLGFALAALVEQGGTGPVLAVDQATAALAELGAGTIVVTRNEPAPQPRPPGKLAPGNSVSISLAAYERAFDAKLRLEAARCSACGTLSYPHRYRCIECGCEAATDTVALPRHGEIYSLATIRVPVPGLISPYTVVIVELGDTGVRTMVKLTGAPAGSVAIGDHGSLVFRLVAVRQGVPDYGYGFLPDASATSSKAVA